MDRWTLELAQNGAAQASSFRRIGPARHTSLSHACPTALDTTQLPALLRQLMSKQIQG
jgi:hypothetical protein